MLRRKLLYGMLPLVAMVLAVGTFATLLLLKLGGAIDVILRENYASVVACQNVREAADNLDLALATQTQGLNPGMAKLFYDSKLALEANLAIELNNITLPGEQELADRLKKQSEYFKVEAGHFIQESVDREALYSEVLHPALGQLKMTAEQIKVLNQNNMIAANNQARRLSARSAVWMIATMFLALIGGFTTAYLAANGILKPVSALIESSKELGQGNLDQVVAVSSKDELGRLAATFNEMAARLRGYRRNTTEQLLRAQQTTEAALEAFPDPILVFSLTGLVELKNSAADRFLLSGYQSKDQPGQTIHRKRGQDQDDVARLTVEGRPTVLESNTRESTGTTAGSGFLGFPNVSADLLVSTPDNPLPNPIPRLIDEVLKGGEDHLPSSFEEAVSVRLEGEEHFYLPRILAMRDRNTALLGVVVALQDVTRFRLADEVKTNLISTVSHELKTPLTSLQMAIYILLEEKVGSVTPKQLDLLIAARQNSDRLLHMIDDLLDLAKFEQGTEFVGFQPIDSKSLVQEAAAASAMVCQDRGIRLETQLEEGLPKVKAGRQQIEHVFSNLLSNAIKYSPVGGTIRLSASKGGQGEVRFSVIDEGPGIPEQFYKRIFEKFFRMGDDKGGVGLGLSIAREIVVAHGGKIGVTSDPDRGSEFYFCLPAI